MHDFRKEKDLLGSLPVARDALFGIHTVRAGANFPLSGRPVHPELIKAYGAVKLACARVNHRLGFLTPAAAGAIETACQELMAGGMSEAFPVDALQGGAGTSTNMNVNEVLANRALQCMGKSPGQYDIISPLDHINLHQSTNDTFPTALRIAAIRQLRVLEAAVVGLQESFQRKEREFAHIVKVGRTEFQDAVPITLGREMSAYAEAFGRDRWRLYKCEERLRVVNLGGTAIGSGMGAPREFIFQVVDALRDITGLGLARAENLLDATQNADVFVEVSGILKALAATLLKVCGDLRLMSSGPQAGLGEISLPELQAGSSIMPGKVNPVIPEAVSQTALLVFGYDQSIATAAALGSLELNAFMPLIAQLLLDGVSLLAGACRLLAERCVDGMQADEKRCAAHVRSSTAALTALVARIGYEQAATLAEKVRADGCTVKQAVMASGILAEDEFEALLSAEAVTALGFRLSGKKGRTA